MAIQRASESTQVTIAGVTYLAKQDSVMVTPSGDKPEEIEGVPLVRMIRQNGRAKMTLYITPDTDVEALRTAENVPVQLDYGLSLYVANSASRVNDFEYNIHDATVDVEFIGAFKKVNA